jgi:YidC/Oxa1 family membrane protein insertase
VIQPIYEAIGWILAIYYRFIPSLGIDIILLTCTVMLVLFPLTAKQARSMIAMQKVQPEIKKIQQKYKGDKQKQNEEVMKFYQENKINPLAGCLPLVVQMPIFFSLFRVLRGLNGDDPSNIPTTGSFARLHDDLVAGVSSATKFLGMQLDTSPLKASGGFWSTLPYFVVVGLIVLSGWYQTRQTQARQGANANPQMQMVGKVMPIMFGVFSLSFPAGLNLYFLTSNSWRIGQQQLVLNKYYSPAATGAGGKAGGGTVEAASRDVTDDGSEAPRRAPDPNTSRKKRKKRKR